MAEPAFKPDYVANTLDPRTELSGEELFKRGYHQLSNKYRTLAPPPPEGADVLTLLRQANPLVARWAEDQASGILLNYWFNYVAEPVALTNQQFKDFKNAVQTGAGDKWAGNAGSVAPSRPALFGGGLSFRQLQQACKNIGYDLSCGFCAAIFYTGVGLPGDAHDPGCSTIQTPQKE